MAAPQQSLALQKYSSLHLFGRRSAGDGENPEADLIDVTGTLYGTTVAGGSYDYGTVFSITPGGRETVLHSFGATGDGTSPMARLLNVNGTLYGTTAYGGENGGGTVLRMSLGGEEKVLHSFDDPHSSPQSGGIIPEAGLIDVQGTLYGTTSQGGATACGGGGYHCGTVFSITPSGKFKVLYSFGKQPGDGGLPQAPLLDVDGKLYGTTTSAGNHHNNGTVFSITTAGKEHTVYSFGTNENDGSNPMSGLINVQGLLYGTTIKGGSGDAGTVFAVTTGGVEAVSFSFNGTDGSWPVADLKNVKGVLYGTTAGGVHGEGTVFRITRDGKEAVLHAFTGGNHSYPEAGLAAIGGRLYGTTFGIEGSKQYGSVFSIAP